MMSSDITRMLDHQRRREMLAAADRRRPASLVRRKARAAKRARWLAGHDPTARRHQGLRKIPLRRVWSWRHG
jgi:hypothetical protein